MFDRWDLIYRQIASDLSLDVQMDEYATELMQELMARRVHTRIDELSKRLTGKVALVFGAGPSLESDVRNFVSARPDRERLAIVTADGATECLISFGEIPDVVVTDLDGNMKYIKKAASENALLLVHAHGDNIPLLRSYVNSIDGAIIATTQVTERRYVHNFGGFTDGDRATIIAARFGCRKLVLAGMDFGNVIGRYSKPYPIYDENSRIRKLKKLRWGKILVEMLAEEISREKKDIELYNATSEGEELKGYKRIRFDDLLH